MVRESVVNQFSRRGKGLWRKGFDEEPSVKVQNKTERVREDENGEDDELPCAIGESGDCI